MSILLKIYLISFPYIFSTLPLQKKRISKFPITTGTACDRTLLTQKMAPKIRWAQKKPQTIYEILPNLPNFQTFYTKNANKQKKHCAHSKI